MGRHETAVASMRERLATADEDTKRDIVIGRIRHILERDDMGPRVKLSAIRATLKALDTVREENKP